MLKSLEDMGYECNPERRINMIHGLINKFDQIHDVLYPDQRAMYEMLGNLLSGKSVVEIGSGIGTGAAILNYYGVDLVATELEEYNLVFAKKMYPGIKFLQWDIKVGPITPKYEIAVMIEVVEHIEDSELVLENLFNSATNEVYFSSPNRNNQDLGQLKPLNDFHVCEYTIDEMLSLSTMKGRNVKVLDPYTFEELRNDTTMTPVLYKVIL